VMATSDNFPPRSRPEKFPQNKLSAAVVAGIGDAGWIDRGISFANKINTAGNRLSRERIVYAYMRSLRERI
jgi:hypothetical protein